MSWYLLVTLSILILFSCWFAWAYLKNDYSVIDICWSLGFIVQGGTVLWIQKDSATLSHFIILSLVTLWSLRLAGYIAYRNRKKGEDQRYTAWRKDWSKNIPLNFYFRVYLLQALLNLLVGCGLILLLKEETIPLNPWAISLALFGFGYESLADYQKDQFKSQPGNGSLPCRKGLWNFSRHPNYFGEILFWIGIALFSWGTSAVSYAWLSPFFIAFFLIKVSGIPILTKQYLTKPQYSEYLNSTSALIPWPPKTKK